MRVVWKRRSQSVWEQVGQIGRNAAKRGGGATHHWSGQPFSMGEKRGLKQIVKKRFEVNEMRILN